MSSSSSSSCCCCCCCCCCVVTCIMCCIIVCMIVCIIVCIIICIIIIIIMRTGCTTEESPPTQPSQPCRTRRAASSTSTCAAPSLALYPAAKVLSERLLPYKMLHPISARSEIGTFRGVRPRQVPALKGMDPPTVQEEVPMLLEQGMKAKRCTQISNLGNVALHALYTGRLCCNIERRAQHCTLRFM